MVPIWQVIHAFLGMVPIWQVIHAFLGMLPIYLAGNTCIPWNAANLARTNIQESASYHWLCGHGHCDLDLGHMTSGLGLDTLLGNGQQLCEILSRSNLTGRSYGPDLDFDGQKLCKAYVSTVTMTCRI